MTFWRRIGFAAGRWVGHTLAAFGLRKGRELVERFRRDDPPPPPPTIPPTAAAVVVMFALLLMGCAAFQEIGIGFGQGVVVGAKDCLRDPDACAPPARPTVVSQTPTPTPSAEPTPSATPTATPDATATPTPSAVPTTQPTPTPRATACPCVVVTTVAFHGVNDGPNPELHAGDQAHFDVTLRGARHPGDGRGGACDKEPWGCTCEPENDPVVWSSSAGKADLTNNGYGLRLSDLLAGTHTVSAKLRPGATDKMGRAIAPCSWPHGSSVRDSITFTVDQ